MVSCLWSLMSLPCWCSPQSTTWPNIHCVGFLVVQQLHPVVKSFRAVHHSQISAQAFVRKSWVFHFKVSATLAMQKKNTSHVASHCEVHNYGRKLCIYCCILRTKGFLVNCIRAILHICTAQQWKPLFSLKLYLLPQSMMLLQLLYCCA